MSCDLCVASFVRLLSEAAFSFQFFFYFRSIQRPVTLKEYMELRSFHNKTLCIALCAFVGGMNWMKSTCNQSTCQPGWLPGNRASLLLFTLFSSAGGSQLRRNSAAQAHRTPHCPRALRRRKRSRRRKEKGEVLRERGTRGVKNGKEEEERGNRSRQRKRERGTRRRRTKEVKKSWLQLWHQALSSLMSRNKSRGIFPKAFELERCVCVCVFPFSCSCQHSDCFGSSCTFTPLSGSTMETHWGGREREK